MLNRDQNEKDTERTLSAEEIADALVKRYGTDSTNENDDIEENRPNEVERSNRRKQKLQEMKRRKKQQELMRRFFVPGSIALVICIIFVGMGIGKLAKKHTLSANKPQVETEAKGDSGQSSKKQTITYAAGINVAGCYMSDAIAGCITSEFEQVSELCVQTVGGRSKNPPLRATADESVASFNGDVVSGNGIFIDVAEERILAQKDAGARISPASMTKILTILVAAEHITDLDDTFEITLDITDYSYVNDCSNAGFSVGEKVTVRDLFYGTILPSGADAAVGLAVYTAGSHEAFVELMNEKIEELGLSKTSHFTNCVGLYNENHYSTVYDMAVMLKAACDNSFCREVLAAHTYTTSKTEQHPDGITISNWFLRRIEDKDTHGEVLCAKTGFVVQSGNCSASLGVGKDGKEYICVTAQSTSSWRCIYDHVALYQQFLPE